MEEILQQILDELREMNQKLDNLEGFEVNTALSCICDKLDAMQDGCSLSDVCDRLDAIDLDLS